MFCKECGSELGEGDKFCANCGQSVHYENVRRRVNSGQAIVRTNQDDSRFKRPIEDLDKDKENLDIQEKKDEIISDSLVAKNEKITYEDKTEIIDIPASLYSDKTEKIILPDELMLHGKRASSSDDMLELNNDNIQIETVYGTQENYYDDKLGSNDDYYNNMYEVNNANYDNYDNNVYETYDAQETFDVQETYYDVPQENVYDDGFDNNYEQVDLMQLDNGGKKVKHEVKKLGIVLLIAVIFVGVCIIFTKFSGETSSKHTKSNNNYSSNNNQTPASTTYEPEKNVTSDDSDEEYIFPKSDEEYLTKSDLENLSKWDLTVARNEIYARHGRKFDNNDLMQYFENKSWYEAKYEASEFSESMLNDTEKTNKELIIQVEKEKGYR